MVSGDDKSGGVYSFEKKDDLEDTYLYGAAKLWRHRPQIFKITPIVIIFLFFSEDKWLDSDGSVMHDFDQRPINE